jgi:protein phosphatase
MDEHAPLWEAAGVSDVGRVRASNEDAFGLVEEAGVFVVCDGMGGAAAGEIASRLAVESVLGRLEELGNRIAPEGETMTSLLHETIAAANKVVFAEAEKNASLHGMGTTLVTLVVRGECGWIAHVGDSRGYRLRGGKLERLTRDHSLVDEQVRMGQLTPEEAEQSPLRNVITRAVGSQRSVAAEVEPLAVSAGDLFLLCSDGLTRELRDEQILEVLREEGSADALCRELIARANAHGGRDNVTCLLVRIL